MKPATFGATIRALREAKGISLRKFAEAVAISPTYTSKVERDEFPPPGEETIKRMAAILEQNADELLALAGKSSSDISAVIQKRPEILPTFFRQAAKLSDDNLRKLMKRMEKMK
jgi:transcriptional regulator with XRE-family HTH domain